MRHIRQTLEARFVDHLDLTDIKGDEEQRTCQKLSRALTAFALSHHAGLLDDEACAAVTDSFADNGIDGLHYDKAASILHLVQAKWNERGEGSLTLGDTEKLLSGIESLLREDYTEFGSKISSRRDEIGAALRNTEINIQITVIHTGAQGIAPNVKSRVDKFLSQQNDTGDVMSFIYMSQSDIHSAVSRSIDSQAVNLEILMRDWGHVKEPYQAFYGRVAASDVALWWDKYKNRIFAKNIRKFISDSAINSQIQETLSNEPHHFWYYNNGVTLLCKSIHKKPLGGSDRDTAIIRCEGATVVNGAQTVGTIGRAAASANTSLANTAVTVRVISLEGCPTGFEMSVTKATNTQNRVQNRDFASLDPEQERIAREMFLDGHRYVFKTGDEQPLPSEGCTIEEATVALACAASDLKWSVMAKGQVGALWEDINRAPYKVLFNKSTTSETVWRTVLVLRAVEKRLDLESRKSNGTRMQVAIHGNRFILRQVFRLLRGKGANHAHTEIEDITSRLLDEVEKAATEMLPNVYLAWTFKNVGKCQQIEQYLDQSLTFEEIADQLSDNQVDSRFSSVESDSVADSSDDGENEAIEGVVDPSWNIEQAVDAASSWYRPGSITSGQARNAAIEAWAACTGRDNASSELNRIIRQYGTESAAARALGMSLATLRRFRRSFARMPINPAAPQLNPGQSAQLSLIPLD